MNTEHRSANLWTRFNKLLNSSKVDNRLQIAFVSAMAIAAILSIIANPNIANRPDVARAVVAKTDLIAHKTASDLYRLECDIIKCTNATREIYFRELLSSQSINRSDGVEQQTLLEEPIYPPLFPWLGYQEAKRQIDPWGDPYIYNGEDDSFRVIEFGVDRKIGGDDLDRDSEVQEQ